MVGNHRQNSKIKKKTPKGLFFIHPLGESPSGVRRPASHLQAAYALPGTSCTGFFFCNAYALIIFPERSGSTPLKLSSTGVLPMAKLQRWKASRGVEPRLDTARETSSVSRQKMRYGVPPSKFPSNITVTGGKLLEKFNA